MSQIKNPMFILLSNISNFDYRVTMTSSEVYFKEVVVVSTAPANLGEDILQNVSNKNFPKGTAFYVLCGCTKKNGEPGKYDPNLTIQFEEMSNKLAEKIESCELNDMHYSLAPNTVLKTKETGMYSLSQFSCSDSVTYFGKLHVGLIYIRYLLRFFDC